MRHLTAGQLRSRLGQGRGVEQFLPVEESGVVAWLTLGPSQDGGLVVMLHRVHDEGSEDFCDVTEFTPVDAEEYVGEGVVVGDSLSVDEALSLTGGYGASVDRWVTEGMVGDEYADRRHV